MVDAVDAVVVPQERETACQLVAHPPFESVTPSLTQIQLKHSPLTILVRTISLRGPSHRHTLTKGVVGSEKRVHAAADAGAVEGVAVVAAPPPTRLMALRR